MRPHDLTALDFGRVCARLADFAVSAPGKETCLALKPARERAVAERECARAWSCHRLLEQHGEPPLHAVADIRPHLRSAAHPGFVLDGKSLLEIRNVLETMAKVSGFFRKRAVAFPLLADLPERVCTFPSLEASLCRTLDDAGGVVDRASDELASIRHTIRRLRDSLSSRLEKLVASHGMTDVVSDTYVTIRNNRFVVPVRAGAAGQLAGVVQDRSISGETLFVEPLFAVDMNNQLLMAVKEEEAIVRRVLADLTALVLAEHEAIGESFAALAEVDGLVARAKFARAYRCIQPTFSTGEIQLSEARHAGLLFTGRPVVPIDLRVPADKRVLVVTGPNTGGKTVAIKTLGLSALMAQSGLLIPAAEGARLPCFAGIFADVGDEQNIERNLSTFSAHIANLCDILSAAEALPEPGPILVLLDEPGVGTDPDEGAALAVGMVQHIERLGAHVAITTHYAPVKAFALARQSCVVAAVDFDVETLTPRYQLLYDSLGRSLALPIAQRLGLPEPVLEAARAAQSESARAFSDALAQLEGSRRRFEEQHTAVDERAGVLAEREATAQRLLNEVRERRRSAWADELRQAREFVRQVKAEGRALLAAVKEGTATRSDVEQFVKEREQVIAAQAIAVDGTMPEREAVSFGLPRVGDTVEVGDRGIRGELLNVDGERAWIQRGALRFEVPLTQLRRVGAPPPSRTEPRLEPHPDAPSEINLIGMRSREALADLESFLDRALRAGHPSVRIIHGIGSGALRRAVQAYLAKSPYCSSYRSGESGEGGEGVTVVMLDG